MRKAISLLLTTLLLFGLLAGCGSGSTTAPAATTTAPPVITTASSAPTSAPTTSTAAATPAATAKKDAKIAFISTTAGLGDEAWNDAIYTGIKQYAAEKKYTLTPIEPRELSDIKALATQCGQQGYDLVIIVENTVGDMLKEVAPKFPKTYFIISEASVTDIPNVTCLQYKTQDGGFLTGAFQVLMSKSMNAGATVGWVGGTRTPITELTLFGAVAGAAYAGGECKTAFVGSYNDIAKAKEIALQMYNSGIAIVSTYAGGSNAGVFQAAETFAKGKYAMGAAMGQFNLSPSRIIASNVKALDKFTYNACAALFEGTLKSGIIMGGIEDNAIELKYSPEAAFKDTIPDSVKKQMDEIKQKIVRKEIVVPITQAELDKFVASVPK